MLGHGGRTWQLIILLALLVWLPTGVWAGNAWQAPWVEGFGGRLPLAWAEAQTSFEAQLLSERPFSPPRSSVWPSRLPSGVEMGPEGGSSIKLPGNVELRISFLYNRDQTPFTPERPIQSHLLFRYSMEYGVLPNLQVGLSGFFYYPQTDDLFYQRRLGGKAMAWGPGVRYDLGRWSFTFRSQLGSGSREGSELQNWFRVWYAF